MQSPKTGRKELSSSPNQIQLSRPSARDVSPLRPITASLGFQEARSASMSPYEQQGNHVPVPQSANIPEKKPAPGAGGTHGGATGDLDDLSRLGVCPTPPRGGRSNSKELSGLTPALIGSKPSYQPDLPLPRAFLRHTESPMSTVIIPSDYNTSDTIKVSKPKIAFADDAGTLSNLVKGEKLPSYNDIEAEDSTGTIKRLDLITIKAGMRVIHVLVRSWSKI